MPPKPTIPGTGVLPTPPGTIQREGTAGPKATNKPGGNKLPQPKPTTVTTPGKPPRNQTDAGVKKSTTGKRPKSTTRRAPARGPAPARRRPRDPELTAILQAQDITVLVPSDTEYERAVASSNLLYRFSRPTYVVQPRAVAHVVTIVREAVHRKMPITIKNGGHSYIGSSFPNDGIMLDLKFMNKVSLDKYGFELL